MDAVFAFHIARHLFVLGNCFLTRLQGRRKGVARMAAAAVVHAVEVSVLEDGLIGAGAPFPGFIEVQDRSTGLWLMKLESKAVHGLDKVVVHEELQSGSDLERLHFLLMLSFRQGASQG